jgi:hypothetical protein
LTAKSLENHIHLGEFKAKLLNAPRARSKGLGRIASKIQDQKSCDIVPSRKFKRRKIMEVGLLRVTVQERRAERGGGHFQFEKLSWPVSLIGMAVNGSRQMVWPAYSGNLVNGQNHSPSTLSHPPTNQFMSSALG